MAPVILLKDAVSVAGRFPVLAGVDLAVDAGEVVVLKGPNGAGKTSLLRACAGLLQVSSGTGEVLGFDLCRNVTALRSRVAFVAQNPALYDDLSSYENIRFAQRAHRSRGSVSGARSPDELLEIVGIGGRLAKTSAGRLSAGQRRRLALACALSKQPALWLLDEPSDSLDESGQKMLAALVLQAARQGATVMIASHEPTHELARRVVTMRGGRVVEDRTRAILVPEPRTEDVALEPKIEDVVIEVKGPAHVA